MTELAAEDLNAEAVKRWLPVVKHVRPLPAWLQRELSGMGG